MKRDFTCKYGVKKVLSTTNKTCFSLQISATAAISAILSVGLVGVSNQTSLVLGLNSPFNASKSSKSLKLTSIPCFSEAILLRYL